jgi:hypothetical protein
MAALALVRESARGRVQLQSVFGGRCRLFSGALCKGGPPVVATGAARERGCPPWVVLGVKAERREVSAPRDALGAYM